MLNTYVSLTQQLLQNPAAPTTLYSPANITQYVNIARGQLAGEGECIRYEGTVQTVIGQRVYPFSGINTGVSSSNGIQGVIHVRRIAYGVASGRKYTYPREWEYFDQFYLSQPVPVNGPPRRWAQYGQGSAGLGAITGEGSGSDATGSFYIDPPPDLVYTLYLDCVCYPILLAADTDPEAIPYLWTDAVPFWAAWYALMASQTTIRFNDAQNYKKLYDDFVQRARTSANPSPLRYLYAQAADPAQVAKLGIQQQKKGAS